MYTLILILISMINLNCNASNLTPREHDIRVMKAYGEEDLRDIVYCLEKHAALSNDQEALVESRYYEGSNYMHKLAVHIQLIDSHKPTESNLVLALEGLMPIDKCLVLNFQK